MLFCLAHSRSSSNKSFHSLFPTVWDAQGWGREARPLASAEMIMVKPRSLLPPGLCMCSSTRRTACPLPHLLLAEPPSAFSTQISPPLLHSLLCVLEAFYKTSFRAHCPPHLFISPPSTRIVSPLSVCSGCQAEGRCSKNANLKLWALYNGSQHTVGCICGFCRARWGVGLFPLP